jgi:hypothetical protein
VASADTNALSVLLHCWHDPLSGNLQLRLERVDPQEELHLKESAFLLRVGPGSSGLERCLIRHMASGREAYVQGGPELRSFITDTLLSGKASTDSTPTERGAC